MKPASEDKPKTLRRMLLTAIRESDDVSALFGLVDLWEESDKPNDVHLLWLWNQTVNYVRRGKCDGWLLKAYLSDLCKNCSIHTDSRRSINRTVVGSRREMQAKQDHFMNKVILALRERYEPKKGN